MKWFLMSLLLAGMQQHLSAAVAGACESKVDKDCKVTVVTDEKTVAQDHNCVVTIAGEPGEATVLVTTVSDDGNDGRSEPMVVRVSGKKDAEERGWLGVSINNVPEASLLSSTLRGMVSLLSTWLATARLIVRVLRRTTSS